MIGICPHCGSAENNKEVSENSHQIRCPECGHSWHFKKLPLFVVTGASGIGKTTALQVLMQHETQYICMEQDLVYFMPHHTPEALTFKREVIMRMAKNISQVGIPVVLGAASIPEQFENTYERRFFSTIYYIALVCKPEALEERMRVGRKIADMDWIESSISFNQWLMDNGESHVPKIEICDITHKTSAEVASDLDRWIVAHLDEWPGSAKRVC